MPAGMRRLVVAILALAGIVGVSPTRADDLIVELPTRPGVTIRYLALAPNAPDAGLIATYIVELRQ